MGLFALLKKIYRADDIDYYDDFEKYEEFGELIDEDKEVSSKSSLARAKSASDKFDHEEEAKLDAQLNLHLSDIQMKKQYENAMKERPSKKIEHVNLSRYSKADIHKFINSQCDILNDASRHIDELKEEYTAVTSYISDIQLIEAAPAGVKKNINSLAERIAFLTVDRKIVHSTANKLSNNVYNRMERIESDMPNALMKLQNDEAYFRVVKKDLRMLEGEKMSLRCDAKDLVKKQAHIKKVSMIALAGLFIAFAILIAASLSLEDENSYLFVIVAVLSAFFAVGLFAYQKSAERQVMLTEIKLNKATNIMNKIKIKYINSANTLDYEYAKYHVKNSRELGKQYEAYQEMKKEKEKVSKMTDELNYADEQLELVLRELRLYDTHIWLAQVKALVDQKEMDEIRRDLSIRRQKLRTQIEYNQNRIDEVKQEIRNITVENPEYKDEVFGIIENYDNENSRSIQNRF